MLSANSFVSVVSVIVSFPPFVSLTERNIGQMY
ncbi:hypothetical protein [Bacteriophage sp.]|nr:hypothetical protein [Bacteriophage sp.]